MKQKLSGTIFYVKFNGKKICYCILLLKVVALNKKHSCSIIIKVHTYLFYIILNLLF